MPEVKKNLPKNRVHAEEKGWIFLYLQSDDPGINRFAERICSYCDEWAVMNFTPAGSTAYLRGTVVWIRGWNYSPESEEVRQLAYQSAFFKPFAIAVRELIPADIA